MGCIIITKKAIPLVLKQNLIKVKIQINGEMISKDELINIAEKAFEILEKPEMKDLLITEF